MQLRYLLKQMNTHTHTHTQKHVNIFNFLLKCKYTILITRCHQIFFLINAVAIFALLFQELDMLLLYHKLILSLFTYSSLFFQCSFLLEFPPYLFTWSTFFRLCFSEDFSFFLCLKVFCIWFFSLENNFSGLRIYIVRDFFLIERGVHTRKN